MPTCGIDLQVLKERRGIRLAEASAGTLWKGLGGTPCNNDMFDQRGGDMTITEEERGREQKRDQERGLQEREPSRNIRDCEGRKSRVQPEAKSYLPTSESQVGIALHRSCCFLSLALPAVRSGLLDPPYWHDDGISGHISSSIEIWTSPLMYGSQLPHHRNPTFHVQKVRRPVCVKIVICTSSPERKAKLLGLSAPQVRRALGNDFVKFMVQMTKDLRPGRRLCVATSKREGELPHRVSLGGWKVVLGTTNLCSNGVGSPSAPRRGASPAPMTLGHAWYRE